MRYLKLLGLYILNILIALDCLLNALLFGDPQETISSRIGKMVYHYNVKSKPILWLVWILDKIDPNHCKDAIEWDEGDRNIKW